MNIVCIPFSLAQGHMRHENDEEGAHSLNKGFVTFPNSSTPIFPPGFNTLYASLKTAGREVQFLIPNAIVYKSIELLSTCFGRSWAFP
jgi:hypothetical protein